MSIWPTVDPVCSRSPATSVIATVIDARPRDLGGFTVGRVLPSSTRRLVGPFIFFDHMAPADFAPGQGIDVRPHPHIGIATVTYLFDGEIERGKRCRGVMVKLGWDFLVRQRQCHPQLKPVQTHLVELRFQLQCEDRAGQTRLEGGEVPESAGGRRNLPFSENVEPTAPAVCGHFRAYDDRPDQQPVGDLRRSRYYRLGRSVATKVRK
jgi:hypothetical protein